MSNWLWTRLVILDKWINDVLFKGRYETISGRCFRRANKGCVVCTWLCKMLDNIDPGHCKRAFYADRIKQPDLPWI